MWGVESHRVVDSIIKYVELVDGKKRLMGMSEVYLSWGGRTETARLEEIAVNKGKECLVFGQFMIVEHQVVNA